MTTTIRHAAALDWEPVRPSCEIDSFFNEKIARERKRKSRFSLLLRLFTTGICVYLLFGVIGGLALVDGSSMEPSISDRSLVLFLRVGVNYEKGNIVLLEPQGFAAIKRVVAVAGDTVEIDTEAGTLVVNGEEEHLLNAVGLTLPRGEQEYPLTVPEGYVYVLGDNREDSVDSRDFGLVSTSELIGRAFVMLRDF